MVTVVLAIGLILVTCGPFPGTVGPSGPAADPAVAGAVTADAAGVADEDASDGDPTADPPPAPEDRTTDDVRPAGEDPPLREVAGHEARVPVDTRLAQPRIVTEAAWTPFAVVADLLLLHPSDQVEVVAFHEANHDGAQQMEILATAASPITLDSRGRDTGSRSAADIVAAPGVAIRSPVTGTVLRAGTYILYCEHQDGFAVIEPDDHPGWEVKVLHIDGVQIEAGERVEAGSTVLASGPTPLPFQSQVDDETARPSWPHVHIEVVDTAIPNRSRPGSGC
jgi:murein DD-endopeptidase MepM/ murein hydrolase activator NlpD